MRFEKDLFYKNLFTDSNMSFKVDRILSQNHRGADLIVSWYQLTDLGKYITIGIEGEFHVPKDQVMHYLEVKC